MNLNERLTQLGEILVALSATPIPSQQFQVIADYANLIMPFDYLGIGLVDPDQQGYWVHSLVGDVMEAVPFRRFGFSEGIAGQVIRTNRRQVVEDIQVHPSAVPELERVFGRFGLRAALILPLRQESKALGALLLLAQSPTRYSPEDTQVGSLLAAGLSAALENARLYQALADERSTLAAVLRSTEDAVLMVNEQGTVLLVNPAAGRKLQIDTVTAVGQPLSQVVSDTAVQELFTHHRHEVVEVTLPDSSVVQAGLVQVVSDYGESIGWAALFRDITLLKQLEQMKNDFVNTVSHDLKNPISTIKLAADLLSKTGDLNERQIGMQRRILETADYMNELVSDLLDLGKIEAGFDMEAAPFDLVQLVQEVFSALTPSAEKKGQQLQAHFPGECVVLGNRGRLKEVLVNLIGNGIKYTPTDGIIEVSITAETNHALIQVRDNGIGIPPTDLAFIFDKFYRVHTDETKNIKGTGLGLAITKSIVEASNGRIWAESIPGKGSTFSFTLPLA